MFANRLAGQQSQTPETSGKVQGNIDLPSVEENQIREYLNKLDICKAMALVGYVLRELTDIGRARSLLFAENYRLVSLMLTPWKVMEQIILEAVSKPVKDKKLVGSSQHGFTKGKSCLTNHKAFDTVSHIILIDKPMKCRPGKWTVRWTENWLKCQAERVVISSMSSSWRQVTGNVPQGWIRGPELLCIFTNDLHDRAECTFSKFADDAKLAEGLTHQRVVLPFREASTGWRNGLTGSL
ncbi:hypothetical protein QYF61_014923 [Mycteria americana]|uniref:Reverse transcriptase domain-containing protein n=1 Tax=Mycteria americana TaxID=33587 RepID=A0AAN7S7B4_MYCAM|nr:hypothetical protein QYF61_014923 [Mycteria americana]